MTRMLSRERLASIATRRARPLFEADVSTVRGELTSALGGRRVLVVGGAGSIGSATVAELSRFDIALHVVDTNENALTELVRDLRGRPGGLELRDFRTIPLDFGSPIMHRLLREQEPYDYVLNFAAIKHVRSEKDAYSLLQMVDTNLVKAMRLISWLDERGGTSRYFSVSTDKAANPVNLMGASKRLMEHVIFRPRPAGGFGVTSARFANVAFSAGSLLEGWLLRIEKGQPVAVPRSTRRYFVSLREAGQLCLIAAIIAPSGSIVIPRLGEEELRDLEELARDVLKALGLRAVSYTDEARARQAMTTDAKDDRYPLLTTALDTSGEKPYEEFIGQGESTRELGLPNLHAVEYAGVDQAALEDVLSWVDSAVRGDVEDLRKDDFVTRIGRAIPEFRYAAAEQQLDQRL